MFALPWDALGNLHCSSAVVTRKPRDRESNSSRHIETEIGSDKRLWELGVAALHAITGPWKTRRRRDARL